MEAKILNAHPPFPAERAAFSEDFDAIMKKFPFPVPVKKRFVGFYTDPVRAKKAGVSTDELCIIVFFDHNNLFEVFKAPGFDASAEEIASHLKRDRNDLSELLKDPGFKATAHELTSHFKLPVAFDVYNYTAPHNEEEYNFLNRRELSQLGDQRMAPYRSYTDNLMHSIHSLNFIAPVMIDGVLMGFTLIFEHVGILEKGEKQPVPPPGLRLWNFEGRFHFY